MFRLKRGVRLRRWTILVALSALVAAGLSVPDAEVVPPGGDSRPGRAQPRGNAGWKPAKPPKSTAVDYQQPGGSAGTPVLKPDPQAKPVKELAERRTAHSSWFQMSDGSVQQAVSGLPIHYQDDKGAWQPIDSTLKAVARDGFTVGASANSFQTYFSPDASKLLRIERAGTFVQMGADGASTKAPETSGASASYPGAYPGADLRYQVGSDAVKESIILAKPPAEAPSYSFTLTVGGGLTPRQSPEGAIDFYGEANAPVFTIPAPYMSDEKADANSPYGKVYSTKVSQVLTFDAVSGAARVTVKPDAAWLADPKRVYPVTIDPTIIVAPTPSTAANTMILAESPTTNYVTSWRLSVGTTAAGAARTLIKFPLPPIPAGTTISSARLQLYYDQTFTTGGTSVAMQALQANAAWSASAATWSNAGSIGGPVAGTATKAANASSVWVDFPVTSAVQSWVNGSPNNGFVLKAANESVRGQGGPRFEGSIYAYGGEVVNYPKLAITYGAPGVAVNAPTVIHSTGAELSWPAYTNTTGDPANDLAEYQVHRSVHQAFTPGQNTMVSPVASGVRSFVDSTAVPTAAASADPYGNAYYYMAVVKTKGGKLIAGPTQLVRLPKAGRTTLLLPATAATTLSSAQPNTVLNTLLDSGMQQPWLEVGNNSATYGVARSVFGFGALSQVPAGSRVVDAHLKLWQQTTFTNTSGAVYELRGLTRSFTGTQATWNSAATGTQWSAAGGDFSATAAGTVSGLTNDPNRRNFDATSIVQGWLTTAGSNHGLVVKLRSETSSSPQERTLFAGRNAAEPRLAPQLVVTYLDRSVEATYYAPATPQAMTVGTTYTTPVTINNTTDATWPAARQVLTYRWRLPDGSDVTGAANQLRTALPSDLAPGATVTLNARVTPPVLVNGNRSDGHVLAWDIYDLTTGTYLSDAGSGAAPGVSEWGDGSLKQWVSVDPTGNNQLGLERFYQYTSTPAGSGTNLFTNLSSGNTVWNYDLFANPSRGFTTLVRLNYNSLSTFDTNNGFGWSMQASAPIRVGQPLQIHPNPNPTEVVMVDGTGNAHKWTWDAATSTWKSPPGIHLFLQRATACGPQTEDPRAWSMTRPDRTVYFFDCDGYPTAQVDANGNEATYTYTERQSQNRPTKFLTYITDPVLRQTLTVTYYAKGENYSYIDSTGALVSATNLTDPQIIDHVKSISDIGGETVNFYYTVEGLLGRLVDGVGRPEAKTFNFTYDMTQGMKNVKLIALQDPRGQTTRITHYPPSSPFKWRTRSVTDRGGNTMDFAYLQPGTVPGAVQRTTVTDARDHDYVYQIDSAGRMIQAVDPLAQTTTLTWDGDNNVATMTENNGARTTWTYDQKTGYPLTHTAPEGPGSTTYTYRFALSGYIADLTDTVSAAGRRWHYTYDAKGNMLTAQEPNGTAAGSGFTTTYTYDLFGSPVTVTDANNHTTVLSYFVPLPVPVTIYEPTGLPRSLTDPLGNQTKVDYGPRGEVISATDPLGHRSTQNYDVFLRPLDSTVPKDQQAGSLITYPAPVYDANDNVTRSTAPNGAVTTAVYDANDLTSSMTVPADTATSPARTITFTYDAVGNRRTTTQPNGNLLGATPGSYTTTVDYDDINRPIGVTDPMGGRAITRYDNAGNKRELTDPLNQTTRFDYDRNHRQTGTTDAQGHTSSVRYDADGLVLQRTNQNNVTTFFSLDANGRITQVQVPHIVDETSVIFNTTQFTYDQVGNNTSVISPRGVATSVADDFTSTATYDAINRRTKVFGAYDPTVPADARYGSDTKPETNFTYDAASRVKEITKFTREPGVPQQVAKSTFDYFDNGWTKKSADPFSITTDYEYNNLGQQISRRVTSSDGTASRLMTWGHYPDGKLASFLDHGLPAGWQSQIVTADAANTSGEFPGLGWQAGPPGQGFDGSTYFTTPGSQADFSWNLTIPQDGNYKVYVWFPALPGAASVRYSVNGSAPIVIDQSQNGGTWVQLVNPGNNGLWSLRAGTGQNVVLQPLSAQAVADAVRVVRDNSGDPEAPPKSMTFTYDANGNRTSVADASPTARFDEYPATFDQLNRLTRLEEKADGVLEHVLTYGYDADSNVRSMTNDDAANTYEYDTLNQLKKVVNKRSSLDPGITTTYTYTPTGQRETQTKGNSNRVGYTYHADGALASIVESTTGGRTISSHLLAYDPNNNITQDISTLQNADNHGASLNRTVTRTYSPNDQVTSVTNSDGKYNQEYIYDSAGNITLQEVNDVASAFFYDRGRITKSVLIAAPAPPKAAYQYDTIGRLFAVSDLAVAGTNLGAAQTYGYDAYDNITTQTSTSANRTTTTTSTYDSLNRPVTAAIRSGDAPGTEETLEYLGVSKIVEEERVSSLGGLTIKTYDFDANGERLAMRNTFTGSIPPTNETSYYSYNPHLDVQALTNEAGETRATYGYTAYGAKDPTLDTGFDKESANFPLFPYNSYRFNGGRITAGTGNLDMGFRTYNPNINQFLSRDSYNGAGADAGLAGGRYGFAGGNPVSNIELDGHDWKSILGSIAVGIGVAAACLALPFVTGGVGFVVCGAVAGAAAGFAAQGITCLQGEEGACSTGAFVQSTLIGAAAGAITAGIGLGVAGALPRSMAGWASDAIAGAVAGGAGGAASYGMACALASACSWGGLAEATAAGTLFGGAFGAGAGAIKGRFGFFSEPLSRYHVRKITNRLQAIVDRTAAEVDTGRAQLTPGEVNQMANPRTARAARGNAIDRIAKERVANDPYLRTRVYRAENFEKAPDFWNTDLKTWWDMTTPGQWDDHVYKYEDPFGTGIFLPTG